MRTNTMRTQKTTVPMIFSGVHFFFFGGVLLFEVPLVDDPRLL